MEFIRNSFHSSHVPIAPHIRTFFWMATKGQPHFFLVILFTFHSSFQRNAAAKNITCVSLWLPLAKFSTLADNDDIVSAVIFPNYFMSFIYTQNSSTPHEMQSFRFVRCSFTFVAIMRLRSTAKLMNDKQQLMLHTLRIRSVLRCVHQNIGC